MKKSEVISNFRFYTKASSDEYSDADILKHFNQIRREMQFYILRSQGYQSDGIDSLYGNLVKASTASAGTNGYEGEYSLDMSILSVKRIELKLTPTSDYVQASIYRITDNDASEFENFENIATTAEPKVKIMRNSLFIRPLPDEAVTKGLRIICAVNEGGYYSTDNNTMEFGDITDDDDVDTVLDVTFHEFYPLALAVKYFMREPEKYNANIERRMEDLKADIDDHYSTKVVSQLTAKPLIHSFK